MKTAFRYRVATDPLDNFLESGPNEAVMKYAILTTFVILTSQYSWAAEPTEQRDSPCIKIMDACKIAGYNKSSVADKKSLSKDCIQPLLNGQKVDGVSVNQSDVDACKAKKNELKIKK